MLRKENLAAFHAAEQCDGVFPLCERGRKQTEEFRLHVGEDAVDHANALGISGSRLQDQRRLRCRQAFEQLSIIIEMGVALRKHPPQCRNDFLMSTTEFFGRFAKQCEIAARRFFGTPAANKLHAPILPNPHRAPHKDHADLSGAFYVDRKSTRLNSSHGYISYAVFCLKKKIMSYMFVRQYNFQ